MEATLSVGSGLCGTGATSFFRITSRSESISIGFKGPRQPVNGWRTASSSAASKILGILAILSSPPRNVYFEAFRNRSGSPSARSVQKCTAAGASVRQTLTRLFSWTRGISLVRLLTRSRWSRWAVYTTNIATPAANISTVVMATTVHPKRELGWPCISFLSEATTRIPTRRKGANNPLMTAVQ
jgi:hypothetical protein